MSCGAAAGVAGTNQHTVQYSTGLRVHSIILIIETHMSMCVIDDIVFWHLFCFAHLFT